MLKNRTLIKVTVIIIIAFLPFVYMKDSNAAFSYIFKQIVKILVDPDGAHKLLLALAKEKKTNIPSLLDGRYSIGNVKVGPTGILQNAYSNGKIMFIENPYSGKYRIIPATNKRIPFINSQSNVQLNLGEISYYRNPSAFGIREGFHRKKRSTCIGQECMLPPEESRR